MTLGSFGVLKQLAYPHKRLQSNLEPPLSGSF